MNKADLEKLGLTTEALEKAGLTADVLDKIVIAHGKDIESHKTKLSTAEAEVKGLKTQLADAGRQIEGFKGLDIEGVKKSADEWKTKAEKAEQDSAAAIANLKFDYALQGALASAKAKNPKAVTALLSRDALKLNEDGSILGLKEQLETIQKESDYLFESATPTPKIVTGGNNKSVVGDAMMNAARKAAGLPTEQT